MVPLHLQMRILPRYASQLYQRFPNSGHARPFTTIAIVSVVRYHDRSITGLTEQDELGIYRELELTLLPSI